MIVLFLATFLIVPWFADASAVNFESAMSGLFFAALCASVYGYSEGDAAVRDCRNTMTERTVLASGAIILHVNALYVPQGVELRPLGSRPHARNSGTSPADAPNL
jgi:hypothetical protein